MIFSYMSEILKGDVSFLYFAIIESSSQCQVVLPSLQSFLNTMAVGLLGGTCQRIEHKFQLMKECLSNSFKIFPIEVLKPTLVQH